MIMCFLIHIFNIMQVIIPFRFSKHSWYKLAAYQLRNATVQNEFSSRWFSPSDIMVWFEDTE